MTTMLERAARAAHDVGIGEHDDVTRSPEDTDLWERIARAVLMAVRVLTGDPLKAAHYAVGVSGSASDEDRGSLVFKCAIDAILNEKDTTND